MTYAHLDPWQCATCWQHTPPTRWHRFWRWFMGGGWECSQCGAWNVKREAP